MARTETTMAAAARRIKAAVDDRYLEATQVGNAREEKGDLARTACYDAGSKRLTIELRSGIGLSIPVAKVQGLADAPADIVGTVRVDGGGYSLHWPTLDLDLSVPDLVAGCFGSRAWMSALGKHGGAVTSEAKRRAARENGKKGGRPPKSAPVPSGSIAIRPRATSGTAAPPFGHAMARLVTHERPAARGLVKAMVSVKRKAGPGSRRKPVAAKAPRKTVR
ncbi:MAG: DUF2442 domain-containing protein [Burkholderiales bacterium]|nr:DUF2442 domain-containing protein [Burkholderiales bacterium]